MSAGRGEEWVYVDLGSRCEFDHVKLYWIARPAEGSVQVSDDAQSWRDLQTLTGGSDLVDDLKLPQPSQGRYVRVLMTRPSSPHGYILSEIEVFGRGGFKPQPKPAPPAGSDGCIVARRRIVAAAALELREAQPVNRSPRKAFRTPTGSSRQCPERC